MGKLKYFCSFIFLLSIIEAWLPRLPGQLDKLKSIWENNTGQQMGKKLDPDKIIARQYNGILV